MISLKRNTLILIGLLFFWLGATNPLWAKSFLWQITNPQNNTSVYVLGSIHLANEALYPLNDDINQAFALSHNLAVEINTLDLDQVLVSALVTKHGLQAFNSDKRLEDDLSPETLTALALSPLYDSENFSNMKPWLLALSLNLMTLEKLGYSPDYGLDIHFMKRAKEAKLKIFEMETLEQQLSMLWGMNTNEADIFLRATLLEIEGLPSLMTGFLSTWKTGDAKGFASLFFKEYDKYPELLPVLDKVVFKRNETLTRTIESYLRRRGETTFVVVGAGHLVGPKGILAILEAKGFLVNQL